MSNSKIYENALKKWKSFVWLICKQERNKEYHDVFCTIENDNSVSFYLFRHDFGSQLEHAIHTPRDLSSKIMHFGREDNDFLKNTITVDDAFEELSIDVFHLKDDIFSKILSQMGM